VAFAWQVNNPQTVLYTTLQVATDPTFLNVLVNQSWWGVVTTHTHPFGADYANLYWRVLLSRENAPIISSVPTRLRLDATPPRTAVRSPIYFVPGSGRFPVQWSGEDATSGIDRYHIDFRAAGGSWTRWLSDTRLGGADFVPPNATLVYEFRSRGIDIAGNVEPAGGADASTAAAVPLSHTIGFPVVIR
jgi:hypothetical protein